MIEIDLATTKHSLKQLLINLGWISANTQIRHLEKPGEGNMNVVMRVQTDQGSFILKQSRQYVQKYPQIAAPIDRIAVEHQFYQLVQETSCGAWLPKMIAFNSEHHLMQLEDLGVAKDYTGLYQQGSVLSPSDLTRSLHFLNQLHNLPISGTQLRAFPDNLVLRKLNYEHLFVYPYLKENGLDFDTIIPCLQSIGNDYQSDTLLKKNILKLGAKYLGSGTNLLHVDYYPGSWLKSAKGFRVIDPEFCFFGPKEYDLGIMRAHLKMAQQPAQAFTDFWEHYPISGINLELVAKFEGMEILRRILGLAQLPLTLSLEERSLLLRSAREQLNG